MQASKMCTVLDDVTKTVKASDLFQDDLVVHQGQLLDARLDDLALTEDILQYQAILVWQHAVHILHK